MTYDEQDFLMISGIQHYRFCPRQWALTHIEQQWQDNYLTTEGDQVHQRVHDETVKEKRGELLTVRVLPVHSREYGIYGVCDAVEFRRGQEGISLTGHQGLFQAHPVEYKHGHLKSDQSDQMQLFAEIICLEEMLVCRIDYGFLYFNETHTRERIDFGSHERQELQATCQAMHQLWQRQHTPVVRPSKKCDRCSLKNICLPEISKKEAVSTYLKRRLS